MNFFNIFFILLIVQFFRGTTDTCLCQDVRVVRCNVNFSEKGGCDAERSFMLDIDPVAIDKLYGLPGKNLRNRFVQWKITKSVITAYPVIPTFDRECILKNSQFRISSCPTEFPIRI